MKKFVLSCLTAAALTAIPISSSFATVQAADNYPYGEQILQDGSRGTAVAVLQQDLRTMGYFTYPTNSGFYGSITAEAVRRFQADEGLEVNGRVGLTTASLLHSLAEGERVAHLGEKFAGVPYVWGGSSPAGFDCSGYVQYVYQHLGMSLPRTASGMYEEGYPVSRQDLRVGDLVFFTTYHPGASHVGIYLGNNQFISATTSHGVSVTSLSNPYWGPRYYGAKRVL